jgi:quinol monooxygenase YgiN
MQYITIVRGRLRDDDQTAAMNAHNAIVDKLRPMSEPMGAAGHQAYVEPQDPGSFVAIDRWSNIEGLQQFLGNPSVQTELGSMFDGAPDVTVLAEREGWRAF